MEKNNIIKGVLFVFIILLVLSVASAVVPTANAQFCTTSTVTADNIGSYTVTQNSGTNTVDAVLDSTFVTGTVDTGQGANELYAMDQDGLTASNPTFVNITSIGFINITGVTDGSFTCTSYDSDGCVIKFNSTHRCFVGLGGINLVCVT